VLGWTFTSPSLSDLLWAVKPERGEDVFFSDLAGYKSFESGLFAVQENFLKVTNRRYYMLDEID
jgi:hypothetical protein